MYLQQKREEKGLEEEESFIKRIWRNEWKRYKVEKVFIQFQII